MTSLRYFTSLLFIFITASRAGGESATWPPEHMRNLPSDYLERCRSGLTELAVKMDSMNFDTSKSEDSITWVRCGLAALVLGRQAEKANQFFESDKFVWPARRNLGFSLFSTDYMRLYALLNHRTGLMKSSLSQAAQDSFEKQMWQVAKTFSKMEEAQRGVWEMEESENHHLSNKVCDLLAAQYLRNIPAYADQKYDDGSTLAQQYEVRRSHFLHWLDARAKRGLLVEAGSPSYQPETMSALFNLRDFSEDPVLRMKADMFLDLAYANMAEETLLTTRGGPKSRVKNGHEYNDAMSDPGYNLLFNAPGRTFTMVADQTRCTSNYYPPPAIVNLAKDTADRGTYVFAKRCPGPLIPGKHAAWRTLVSENSILRHGLATRDYILGSAALDVSWLDDLGMGFRWQGVIFASDPLARIGFEVKPASDKEWHGFNPFFSVQDRNLLITQKWAPTPPNPPSAHPARLRIYFSPTLDHVQEEDGWILVKDGNAYAAVKAVFGGHAWTPSWKHGDSLTNANKSFITLQAEDSPVITIVNQSADYAHDFNAFKAAVKAQPIQYRNGTLQFATITFHGPAQPGQINGQPVNLAPARGYDSAFIRSDWDSGIIQIRKGDATVTLDFSDPNKPIKTIGAPISPAFPAGTGSAQPIILGKPAP